MQVNKIYPILILLLILSSCKPEERIEIEDCNEDCLPVSEIQTKTDYYAPLKLHNDISTSELNRILLNGLEIDLDYGCSFLIEESGFYELVLEYTSAKDKQILFTIKTVERENSEWGIGQWVPNMFTTELITNQEVKMIYPRLCFDGIGVPVIFYLFEGDKKSSLYSNAQHIDSQSEFYIKRGVGSINLKSSEIEDSPVFSVGGKVVEISTVKKIDIDLEISGLLSEDLVISENSVVAITSDLHIPSNVSVTIEAGALILVNEAVNIFNEGPVEFIGKEDSPIFVTCRYAEKYWGGFISKGTNGIISARNTIFTQSGHHIGETYNWGHAKRQALFYTERSSLDLYQCYMIDHIGQIFYPLNSSLELESILVQRVKTGGQFNNTTATISNSIFSDFPDDSQNFYDNDNDALYLNASDVTIDNCIFMFAKDDGLDSGADGGGTVNVSNSHFEACFHEGAALSSKEDVMKQHTFTNCVFFNCGQGIELGFSSSNHLAVADGCEFLSNGIGIRYGDNYTWADVNGRMLIKNSRSLHNTKDVWNMVRMLWSPKLENLQFDNVQVSSYNEQYPNLQIINE